MPPTMAAAHSATAVFHFPAARKPPSLGVATSTRFLPKLTKRINYPQTKIFNTLPKPLSNPQTPEFTPTNPSFPADSSPAQQFSGTEVKVSIPIEQLPASESQLQSPSNSASVQSPSEGLNGFEPVGKQTSSKEYVPVELKRSRFDIKRFLNEKIEEAEEREYSYWQSVGSPQTGNGFAGNTFSIPTIIQVGLSFIAAIVIDVVWSISMERKLNAMIKEKERKLVNDGSDDRSKTTIWERWAERKRKRNEVKNEGDVAIVESTVDKKTVETPEMAMEAREVDNLAKGSEVENEGDVAIDELAKEAHGKEKLGSKGNDSNEDGHVLENKIQKEG